MEDIMWDERWKITRFLYEKGWMLTFKELEDVLKEYGFEEEYVIWRKNLSTSHNTDYDFGSEKEPQPKGKDASHPSHNH